MSVIFPDISKLSEIPNGILINSPPNNIVQICNSKAVTK